MIDLLCCIPGSICCCCNKDRDTAEIHKQDSKPKKVEAEEESGAVTRLMNRFKQYNSPITTLVVYFYSPFLQNYIVKAVVIVIFSIWFGFSVWGCTRVEDGLDLDDVLPEGTVEHSFASANVRHFAAYSFNVITKDINYSDPEVQLSLIQMSTEVATVRNVVLAGGLTSNWLSLAIRYFVGIHMFYQGYCLQLAQPPDMQEFSPSEVQDFIGLYTVIHTVIDISNLRNGNSEQDLGILLATLGPLVNTCSSTLPPLVIMPVQGVYNIPSDKFYRYIAAWVSSKYI